MAYARTADEPRIFAPTATPRPKNRRGFFRRVFAAMADGRRRAAEREIAAFIGRRGGRLTDDIERDIERFLFSSTHL